MCRFSDLFHFVLNCMLHFKTLIISNIMAACVIGSFNLLNDGF